MTEREIGSMTPGMKRYVEASARFLEQRSRYIEQEVKCWRFDTLAVHGLYSVQEAVEHYQGSIIEPLFMSTAQAFRDSDEMAAALGYQVPAWVYSRIANPTVSFYEWTLALLEGYGFSGETSCCATSSGMSAILAAVQPFLSAAGRDEKMNFVATAQCYGGTFQLFSVRLMQERNIDCRWVRDGSNLEEWADKIDENTRFLYGELPSNPQQGFFDIARVAELAHAHEIPLICDSTVATPALLRPLCHGADIVVQSATKSMTSSGFGICGAVIARKNLVCRFVDEALRDDFALAVKLLQNRDQGPSLQPVQALMTLNDLRTLRSKMDLMSRNTMRVAQYLRDHPLVENVRYLGLPEHPQHDLACRYLWLADAEHDELYNRPVNRFGHLLSFEVAGGREHAHRFFDGLRRIWRATDLGRIKSVATIPAISTHQQQGSDGQALAGITPNMVRLSVGAEHPDDIISDLQQALEHSGLNG